MLKAVRNLEELRQQADSASPISDANRPLDLLRDLPAPPFADDTVPPAILNLSKTFSAATGFDRSGLMIAAVGAAGAMIDDRARLAVRPASGWFESARLWLALIGSPSAGKTPTLRAATDPVKDKHMALFQQWRAECPDGDGSDRPALFTSDTTVEKLSDILLSNPRSVLMLTEEFASWLGAIDAYHDGAGTKGRGEWLQLYDGGPHQIDRVKRGSFLVPNWSCSVMAAATPAGLRSHLKQLPDDGLIHRFMFCVMQRPGPEASTNAKPALDAWSRLLWKVFDDTTTAETRARYRLSVNAQLLFDAERAEIRDTVDALEDVSPALASHIGKHPGVLARVALIFHVLDRGGEAVEPDTMQTAIRFMRTVRRHAAVVFLGILGQSSPLELVRSVARSILAGSFNTVGRHTLTQHCRAWRAAGERDQRQVVQMLEDANWLVPDSDSKPYAGWNASRWFVNPAAQTLFADAGTEHRARRERIRESVLGGADE
jgi:hypothetical protein